VLVHRPSRRRFSVRCCWLRHRHTSTHADGPTGRERNSARTASAVLSTVMTLYPKIRTGAWKPYKLTSTLSKKRIQVKHEQPAAVTKQLQQTRSNHSKQISCSGRCSGGAVSSLQCRVQWRGVQWRVYQVPEFGFTHAQLCCMTH
jgi:hypothetical protein